MSSFRYFTPSLRVGLSVLGLRILHPSTVNIPATTRYIRHISLYRPLIRGKPCGRRWPDALPICLTREAQCSGPSATWAQGQIYQLQENKVAQVWAESPACKQQSCKRSEIVGPETTTVDCRPLTSQLVKRFNSDI